MPVSLDRAGESGLARQAHGVWAQTMAELAVEVDPLPGLLSPPEAP